MKPWIPSGYLDALYYEGGTMTEAGQEFLNQMDTYKNGMVALLGDSNPTLTAQINNDFSTADITDGEGVVKDYHKLQLCCFSYGFFIN